MFSIQWIAAVRYSDRHSISNCQKIIFKFQFSLFVAVERIRLCLGLPFVSWTLIQVLVMEVISNVGILALRGRPVYHLFTLDVPEIGKFHVSSVLFSSVGNTS